MCSNNVLVLGQCGSPTTCNSNGTRKRYTQSALPPNHNWYDDSSGISLDERTPTPAERCRRNCERICSGNNRRVQHFNPWSGCKAFTSFLKNPNGGYCQCWGYNTKPDFDEGGDYLSGWCELARD